MPLHLYCIVPAGRAPDDLAGIDAAAVRAIAAGDIACWASAHDERPVPTAAAVRDHNDVITAAMDTAVTPVPLRFGQSVGDADGLRRELQHTRARWTALLDRFAGHVEFGLRVEAARPPAAAEAGSRAREMHTRVTNPGTEYMAALARRQATAAQRRAEAERIAALIRDGAAEAIRDCRVEHLTMPGGLFTMANLVAWEGVATYHACVQQVRTAHAEWRFLGTGPWPPYSFVA